MGKTDNSVRPVPNGYREVICKYVIRKGKVIYPKKAKAFRFLVKVK